MCGFVGRYSSENVIIYVCKTCYDDEYDANRNYDTYDDYGYDYDLLR